MIDAEILGRIESSGITDRIKALQTRTLGSLFSADRVKRVLENEALNGNNAYKATQMMSDLRTGIFSELRTGRSIDTYRRNLQKAFVEQLGDLVNIEDDDIRTTDIPSLSRGNLVTLRAEINRGLARQSDQMSRYHLQDLVSRIDQILDPRG